MLVKVKTNPLFDAQIARGVKVYHAEKTALRV
jgi:hypothetical protein